MAALASPGAAQQTSLAARYSPDEAVTHLQKRLSQECADRDATRALLQRMKATVDHYRQRMMALVSRPAGTSGGGRTGVDEMPLAQRMRELVRDMEAEIKNTAGSEAAHPLVSAQLSPGRSPKPRGYEVLRQSLEEAQRRAESLNTDMVYQAEANEELVDTLATVKDANKRLLEQIRAQTWEIAQLTQQRVADEEKMEQLHRAHDQARETHRQESHKQLRNLRDICTEKHNQVLKHLTGKLRSARAKGELVDQDVARLRRDLQDLSAQFLGMVSTVSSQLQSAQRDVPVQCEVPLKRHEQAKAALLGSIDDLKNKLQSEREARHKDGLAWGVKHGALGTDKEHVHATHTRDAALLNTQLQALQKTIEAEKAEGEMERAGLEHEAGELARRKHDVQAEFEQIERDIVALESAVSTAMSETTSMDDAVVELKRHIRESDDALAAAVSGNEHLREQMEEQRQRFQEKNEAELEECRELYEEKLVDAQQRHEADVHAAQQQLEAMAQQLHILDDELASLKSEIQGAGEDLESEKRQLQSRKSQVQAAKGHREARERELCEAKHRYQGENLRLQANSDKMAAETSALEDQCKALSAELQEMRRFHHAGETERASRHAAAEAALKDTQDQVANLRSRLRENADEHTRVLGEAQATKGRSLDMQDAMKRNLENQVRAAEVERRRLQSALEAEQRASDAVRGELGEFHNSRPPREEAFAHPGSPPGQTERERARQLERQRLELTYGGQALSRKSESLEHDLSKLHSLLAESEANLEWVRQETENEEREAAFTLRHLEEEVRSLSAALENARRQDADLAHQLEGGGPAYNRGDFERGFGRRSVDELVPSVGASPPGSGLGLQRSAGSHSSPVLSRQPGTFSER